MASGKSRGLARLPIQGVAHWRLLHLANPEPPNDQTIGHSQTRWNSNSGGVAKRDISDPLAVHHIFPRELLRQHEIKPDQINCMANYAVLSQADNAEIGEKNPKSVYDALSGKAKDYADGQLFFILAEKRDWVSAYEAFLQTRADILAARLNEFLRLSVS